MEQIPFPKNCTDEEYSPDRLWMKGNPPACPFCKDCPGNSKQELVGHSFNARVEPTGTLICAFRYQRTGRTVSLLPVFLLTHRHGEVQSL